MPRVSIILTCYNHAPYLHASWQSVWSQVFTDFELIVVDDCSTDGTRDWLCARTQPYIRVFNDRNIGTYASLNRGLKEARGEFVAILNDDDVWAAEKLARQVALMDRHPHLGLAHTDGWFIDEEGTRVQGAPLGFEFPRFETGDVLLDLVYQNKIIASAALVRMRCFQELGGFDPFFFGSGDWHMWFRIVERWDVGFIPEPLTFYRVHPGQASKKLDLIWQDDEKLRTWMAERLRALDQSRFSADKLRAAIAHNWAALGTVRTLNGDPAGGRRAYRESIKAMPGRAKSWMRYAATYLPRPCFRALR